MPDRRLLWQRYHEALEPLELDGLVERPHAGGGSEGNGHIYHILLRTPRAMTAMLESLKARGIGAVFHYVPLHSSPGGKRFGRAASDLLPVTDEISGRLLRLPLWSEMTDSDVDLIVDAVKQELLRGVQAR